MDYIDRPNQIFYISHYSRHYNKCRSSNFNAFIEKCTPFIMKHEYGFFLRIIGEENPLIDIPMHQPLQVIEAVKKVLIEYSHTLKNYLHCWGGFYNSKNKILYYLIYDNDFTEELKLYQTYFYICRPELELFKKLDEDSKKYWKFISDKLFFRIENYSVLEQKEFEEYKKMLKSKILAAALKGEKQEESFLKERFKYLNIKLHY